MTSEQLKESIIDILRAKADSFQKMGFSATSNEAAFLQHWKASEESGLRYAAQGAFVEISALLPDGPLKTRLAAGGFMAMNAAEVLAALKESK